MQAQDVMTTEVTSIDDTATVRLIQIKRLHLQRA
jgi:hypothetical protein